MKSIVLSSVVVAVLVFSGCSSKEPSVDASSGANTGVGSESAKTMNGETNEMRIARLEKQFSSVYFDFDKFDIRADMQSKVSDSATLAKTEAKDLTIKLEGNCDEWGSDEYNFALGLKRAEAVKKSLVTSGVDASKITMVSYGESNAVCTEKTKDCWSKNRRVDYKLLP
ncbi:MAG: OmpA family protein [Sulfurimonas sp.]|jgi:peptidoglycan-associated lipoprotein